jgi:S1-C subfamily serine protease
LPRAWQRLHPPGAFFIRETFDEKGRAREMAFFSVDGKPVNTKRGDARFVVDRDGTGAEVGRRYYNAAGKQLYSRVVIDGVGPGSQAEKLGLQDGDMLLRYDGKPVGQMHAFVEGRKKEGKKDGARPLVVGRGGKTVTVQVSPGPLGVGLKESLSENPPGPAER